MYVTAAILVALFFLFLFSQFGSRLPARHALIWWCTGIFLLTATLFPELFQGLAHALGVTLGSNLIFAGLFLLLIFLMVEQGADLHRSHHLIRDLSATEAARSYLGQAKPQWPAKESPRVLVVLPAFNEQSSLPDMVARLEKAVGEAPFNLDYCFVDDGSADSSVETLESCAPRRYARHSSNLGVAGALLTGIKIAEGRDADFLVQCDADGQHPVDKIQILVAEAVRRQADLMIGSRYSRIAAAGEPAVDGEPPDDSGTRFRRAGGWILALALKGFRLPDRITDPTSGFRIYSRNAYRFLSNRMPDEYPEPESIALLSWRGLKVSETRVRMAPRREGVSTIRGLKTVRYMSKVLGGLMGLRLRILFSDFSPPR